GGLRNSSICRRALSGAMPSPAIWIRSVSENRSSPLSSTAMVECGSSRRIFSSMPTKKVQDRFQLRGVAVLRAQQGLLHRPVDPDLRIVPDDPDLVLAYVEIGALVLDVSGVAQHAEAVREAGGHPELPEVVAREGRAHPLAQGRGVGAEVHGHVEDLSQDRP